jgi:hypothetical protein
MVVGSKYVNLFDLKNACLKGNVVQFATDLVPCFARHTPSIIDNQRYYLALLLRKNSLFTYHTCVKYCNILVQDITICGMLNEVYDISDLFIEIDKERFAKCLERSWKF